MKAKYAKAETNVNEIIKALEKHQVQLMKDTALLDKMYELNLTYFKELSMYILAGKKKLAEVKRTQLADLMSRAQASGLPEDAQAAKDLDEMCIRFEKKIHDLELTRMISIQTAPQIRLVQNNDTMMVEKIQSTIVNTIPLWKSQMVLALGVEHSTQAAEAQRRVTDVTNELLKKNAEKLKIAGLIRAFEHVRAAELLSNLRILLRPEQLEIVVVDLLIAARNASAVPPALSLRRIGARDQRGAIKDAVLIPLLLTVRTADLRNRPSRRVRSNAIVHEIHLLFFPKLYSWLIHPIPAAAPSLVP